MEFLDTLAKHPALFIGCCTVLGLLVGSFLNVVIYRLPVMMDAALRDECAELAVADSAAATTAPAGAPELSPDISPELPLEDLAPPADANAGTDAPGPVARPAFNLVVPRSACPTCKAPITAAQNIPVI